MKVRISDLSPEGLVVKGSISLENLNSRMKEGRTQDITFVLTPTCDLQIFPTHGGGAAASGTVRSKYKQECGRCLEPKEREIEVEVRYVLEPRPDGVIGEPKATEDGAFTDDVGLVYFEGDQFDLEELIQESLILPLSQFWSPPADEKGNCQLCGFNLKADVDAPTRTTIKLGDLLKKAAKSNVH